MRNRLGAVGLAAAVWALSGGCGDGSEGDGAAAGGGAAAVSGGGAGQAAGSRAGAGGVLAAGTGAGTGAGGAGVGASGAGAGGAGAGGTAGSPLPAAGTRGGGGSGGSGGSTSKLTAQIVAKNVPPEGQEHVCVVVELSNQTPVWVNEVHATLSGGSHHLIVDRQPSNAALYSEPKVCAPTMASDASRLIIAQQKETSVVLPAGVAFKLEAHQRLFLQLHYLNVSATAHDISGTVEMSVVDASQGAPIEAKTLFTGATQIMIPAHQMVDTKAFYLPKAPAGTRRVFALTSHTHKLGVKATIERVASMTAAATTPLHTSTDWSEPPLTQLSPPLEFTGSDGLRLICSYNNTTDDDVTFGVEAQDEMCFMWLYYYDK